MGIQNALRIVSDVHASIREQYVVPWTMFAATNSIQLTDPNGKRISYSGVEFSGSVRQVYWNNCVKGSISLGIKEAFDRVRSFCAETGIDYGQVAYETKEAISTQILITSKVANGIDHKMANDAYDVESIESAGLNELEASYKLEIERVPPRKSWLKRFAKENQEVLTLVAVIIAFLSLLISGYVAMAG